MSRNQPSRLRTLERSIHPLGTCGIAHTTHIPLAVPCLSLWIAGTQQWPLSSMFVLSRSPPCSPEQLHQQPQGKQRHKTPTKIQLVQLLDLPVCQRQPFLPQGEVGRGEGRKTHEDPCLSLGFKCHILCDSLQECSHSPFSAEPLEHFLFAGVS